jgi:hypothetical protein
LRDSIGVFRRNDVAGLIFAEPKGVRGNARWSFEHRANPRRHRHFSERDEEPAIGNIVGRGQQAVVDQTADEFAVAAFGGEVDRRRRALFPLADVAQIERLAEPAARFADQPTPPMVGVGKMARPFVSL